MKEKEWVLPALERNGKDVEGVAGGRIRTGKAYHCLGTVTFPI
jgi:hypothetical protein